jgi:hypothetical protein
VRVLVRADLNVPLAREGGGAARVADRERIDAALREVAEPFRTALVLKEIAGMPVADVAMPANNRTLIFRRVDGVAAGFGTIACCCGAGKGRLGRRWLNTASCGPAFIGFNRRLWRLPASR